MTDIAITKSIIACYLCRDWSITIIKETQGNIRIFFPPSPLHRKNWISRNDDDQERKEHGWYYDEVKEVEGEGDREGAYRRSFANFHDLLPSWRTEILVVTVWQSTKYSFPPFNHILAFVHPSPCSPILFLFPLFSFFDTRLKLWRYVSRI